MWQGLDMYGLICQRISRESGIAIGGLQRAYTTVRAVCSASLLGGLVDLDVLDNQVASIETFGICVCFGVLKKTWNGRKISAKQSTSVICLPRRNSADLTGHRARETPNCFPVT